jgi:MYXO-CTERM domain-containing protein
VEDIPAWRGDENTSHFEWQSFEHAGGSDPMNWAFPNMPTSSSGAGSASLYNFADGAMISSGNIYGFGGPLNIHTYAYTAADAQDAVINISTAGSPMDYESLYLAWHGADGESGLIVHDGYATNYMVEGDFGGFPGVTANVSYTFDLSAIEADIREVGIIFSGSAAHMSLDAVSLDLRTAAIPAPGVLALLGIAGAARRRRRRN